MIVGKCSQESLPYTFQIKDGAFSSKSQLATISVKQFSFFGAIRKRRGHSSCKYVSYCYVKRDLNRSTSWTMRFMITKQVKPWTKVDKPFESDVTFSTYLLSVTFTAGYGGVQGLDCEPLCK